VWPFRKRRREARGQPRLTFDELRKKADVLQRGHQVIDLLPLDDTAKQDGKAYREKKLRQRVRDAWDSQL